MSAHAGIGASLKVDSSGGVLTEIATYLTDISGDVSTDELDGTTFQPGATTPTKYIVFGATERTMSVTGMWTEAAETFFSAIDGLTGLDYEYGPLGTATGRTKISGTLNAGGWSGPQQTVNGLITFTMTFKINSRTVGTF
ncbi:MAG TPA: hypothetical protein VJ777_32445 [Mycobacterium sp.]|nr:hypothetical protein [Mycobacterium sp.]